jgi:hypothetical protein
MAKGLKRIRMGMSFAVLLLLDVLKGSASIGGRTVRHILVSGRMELRKAKGFGRVPVGTRMRGNGETQ